LFVRTSELDEPLGVTLPVAFVPAVLPVEAVPGTEPAEPVPVEADALPEPDVPDPDDELLWASEMEYASTSAAASTAMRYIG
jgi:hypothetical protein